MPLVYYVLFFATEVKTRLFGWVLTGIYFAVLVLDTWVYYTRRRNGP